MTKRSTTRTLLMASALALTTSAAFAQSSPPARYNDGARYNDNRAAAPLYSDQGEQRGTAYGQGGTAGTHPTGANVGPGRAGMDHATGN